MAFIRKATTGVVAAVTIFALAGCTPAAPQASGSPSSAAQGYPVSVENCGRTLTFDSAPGKVLSLWQAPTEMMLALGLGDRVVARAGDYATYPASVAAEAENIASIGTAMGWPDKETVLSYDAELILGQSLVGFAFDTSMGYASVEQLEESGAQVYGANVCDAVSGGALDMTLDTPLDALRDLGTIFGVSDRAEVLIASLEEQRQAVIDAVAGKEEVKVAFYNGGDGPLIVLAGGIYDDAITTAGGINAFPRDSVYVGKEEFAAAEPDVILVGTFTGQDYETLSAFLRQTFPELKAVQEDRLVEIPVADTDASISVMRGLTQIANGMHGLELPVPTS